MKVLLTKQNISTKVDLTQLTIEQYLKLFALGYRIRKLP